MENSAPPWAHNKAKAEMASPAITTTHTSTSTSSSTTSSSDPVHHRELSCTLIQEVLDSDEIVAMTFPDSLSTILDSGMTSHLIRDKRQRILHGFCDRRSSASKNCESRNALHAWMQDMHCRTQTRQRHSSNHFEGLSSCTLCLAKPSFSQSHALARLGL